MAIDLNAGFNTALSKTTSVTGVSGAASASIACWYYCVSFATSSNFVVRLTGPGGADTMAQLYTFTDGSFNWSSDDGTFENAKQQAVVVNQWHHYAVVYTQTTVTAYYDGVSIGSVSHTFGARASQTQIVLGPCQGYIQDVQVYSDVLTGNDILGLFRARPTRTVSTLIGWYPCFAGSRTTDFGPNSWNLTESGSPADAPKSAPAPWRGPINKALRVFLGINAATAAGLTQATGAAANIEVFTSVAAGLTQVTGAAPWSASAPAAGLTKTSGAAIPFLGTVAAGLTITSAAAIASVAAQANGLTQTTGSAAGASSSTPTGPPIDQFSRRFFHEVGRRHVR